MMTQSDLLELAKTGNAEAIASLMNLVLEPKGVTAKTALKDRCLHIFFTSNQPLSQTTLMAFVQSGLKTLALPSVERARVYAQKVGQASPLWIQELALQAPNNPVPIPPPAIKPAASLPQFSTSSSRQSSDHPAAIAAKQASGKRPPAPSPHRNGTASVMSRLNEAIAHFNQTVFGRFDLSNRYVIAAGVGMGAFLIGGVVALMTNSQAGTTSPATGSSSLNSAIAPSHQSFVSSGSQSAKTPEAEAEQYLAQMNKAQQAFYGTNQRFATSLEELERSASLISQSSNYTYRLVLRDQAQSVLTATPKTDKLKSYTGTVAVNQSSVPAGIICVTNQPSQFPPIVPQAIDAEMQCPADSSQIANN